MDYAAQLAPKMDYAAQLKELKDLIEITNTNTGIQITAGDR